MAKIQSSRAKIYETKATFADEPTEHVESEGERLIKQMVLKQLDTQFSLEQQLIQTKEFKSSTEIVPLSTYTSGQTSLKEFEESTKKASYIEELKSFGLSGEEIELLLDYEKGEDEFAKKYRKLEKCVLSSRLLLIHAKIEQGKKEWENWTKKSAEVPVSRHEQELGMCVKPESEHTKLLRFALSCRPSTVDLRPPSHPIHQLKDIEEELFGHLAKKKRRLKKKNTSIQTPSQLPINNSPLSGSISSESHHLSYIHDPARHSLWDIKEGDKNLASSEVTKQTSKPNSTKICVYSCKPEILYTVRNQKIVPLEKPVRQKPIERAAENSNICSGQAFVVSDIKQSSIKTLSLEDIQKNRISLEDIKSLPRFKDYEEGSPSKVLFLKNLAGSVKEEELVSLFGQFEDPSQPRILYRLMNGKMRGQAFITFQSVETAKTALGSVNGFILKEKPIIIQYGKGAS